MNVGQLIYWLIVELQNHDREQARHLLSVAHHAPFSRSTDGIECDVQRSKDGELVLYHDFGSSTISQ